MDYARSRDWWGRAWHAGRIAERNRVSFASRAEAEAVGYRVARIVRDRVVSGNDVRR